MAILGRRVVCALALLGLAACAGATGNYTAPSVRALETERIINQPFEQAWNTYVGELSKSFFVINNIAKDSGIINVSYSTDQLSRFADCGHTDLTSSHPATGEEHLSYQTADSAVYNMGQEGTNILWTVTRKTHLEGRVNIYMAPQGGGETLLRVNAKYVWSVSHSGVSNVGTQAPGENWTLDFSSTAAGKTVGADPVTCAATGELERELLYLI
jgi:hypothetical protein